MLLFVKHGTDEHMFHMNCRNVVLMNYLKEFYGLDKSHPQCEVDLISADPAKLADPKTQPVGCLDQPDSYAQDTPGMADRGRYALITYVQDEDGSRLYRGHLAGDDGAKLKVLMEQVTAARTLARGGKGGGKPGKK